MTTLSSKKRDKLPDSAFALPGRRYPIHDQNHARAALSMVAAHGTPSERATVRRKVKAKFPGIDVGGGGPMKASEM